MRGRPQPCSRPFVNVDEVLEGLRANADPSRLPGMARVGIETSHALGVSVPSIRRIAKRAGTDHALARSLWATGIHEARMVAALVADPAAFSFTAMGAWARDLDSWDITDMVADTFVATPHADRAIHAWSTARHGFTKRCAFSMLARLAVGHRTVGCQVSREVRVSERADFLDEYFAAVAGRDQGKIRELLGSLAGAERLRTGAREKLVAHEATHDGLSQ